MSEKEIKDTETRFSAKEAVTAFVYGGILGTLFYIPYIQTQRTETNKIKDVLTECRKESLVQIKKCKKKQEATSFLYDSDIKEQKSRIIRLQESNNIDYESLQAVIRVCQTSKDIYKDNIAELQKSLNTCLNDGYIQTDK